jgi:hypothetical protein
VTRRQEVQDMLDRNEALIVAALDSQMQGRVGDSGIYLRKLFNNLVVLASIADSDLWFGKVYYYFRIVVNRGGISG